MNASRRWGLSVALVASLGTPAWAQVDLPPPPSNGAFDAVPAPGESPAAPEQLTPASRLRVAADPRIELMSLLLSRTRQGKLAQDDVAIAYRTSVESTFQAFDSHPAVKQLEDLQAQGFDVATAYRFAMALSVPHMALENPLPPELAAREDALGPLADAIQAYASGTRFMDFYGSQGALFSAITEKAGALVEVDDVLGRMESFYGVTWDRLTVVPAPLLTRESFGIPVMLPDGSREIVAIVGPLGATGTQEPDFFQPQGLFLAIEGAIGQAVIPALTARFAQDVAESETLFTPLAERLRAQGLATWADALDAHLLRAVGARMLQARGKVREAQIELNRHEKLGYWYVRKFFDLLASYEADREAFPTLESYYPRLLLTLSFLKDAGEHQRIEAMAKRFMGPIAAASEERFLRKTVLVRPEPEDPELKQQADLFVRRLVARYRERHGITLPVMTSFQAAAADPAQTVFLIYGTPESNDYLKALLRYVPIKVSKGDLHLGGRQFSGADLRLVTAIPNPYNPALPMRIVTGSTDELVLSEFGMPHTQSDFALYKGGTLFRQGDFIYDEKGAWKAP